MENMRKIIIITIIIIFILICILLILLNFFQKKKSTSEEYLVSSDAEEVEEPDLNAEIAVTNASYFYMINDNISYFINNVYALNKNEPPYDGYSKDEKNKKLYNQLSRNFIDKNNITLENIANYFSVDKYGQIVFCVEMNQKQENTQVINYAVKAMVMNSILAEENDLHYLYFKVSLDYINQTYAIEPVQVDNINEIDLNTGITQINENDDNKEKYYSVDTQDIIENYTEFYKTLISKDANLAYEYLDDEYKKERFHDNLDEFNSYVNDRKKIIYNIELSKYLETDRNGYKEYIIVDEENNSYVFKENNIMDFKICLDNYTIKSETVKEKYNSYNTKTKVAYNINKFITMANTSDYKNMYNLLSDGFKNNKFQTEEQFEEYIKQNLYDNNKIEYGQFKNEGEIYIYDITISDANEEKQESKSMSVIMKLEDDMNFEMSFNME